MLADNPLSPGSGHDPAPLRVVKRWTKLIRTYKAVSGRKYLDFGKILRLARMGLTPGPRAQSLLSFGGRFSRPPAPTLYPQSQRNRNPLCPRAPSLPSAPAPLRPPWKHALPRAGCSSTCRHSCPALPAVRGSCGNPGAGPVLCFQRLAIECAPYTQPWLELPRLLSDVDDETRGF